ncbi:MAG: hypothetical protein ACFFEN_12075 [Candidatus Thorarchaeota archaeon]
MKENSSSLLIQAVDIAPQTPFFLVELANYYQEQGDQASLEEVITKIEELEIELGSDNAMLYKYSETYNSMGERIHQNSPFSQFTHDGDFITQMITFTSELSKWLEEGKCALLTNELVAGIQDCLICLEWISLLASIAQYKIKRKKFTTEENLTSPLKVEIENLLDFYTRGRS